MLTDKQLQYSWETKYENCTLQNKDMTSTNQTNQPIISVIICTYNRSAMLKEAIDSVLAQSYPYKEIIVLDGNSPDNTPEMMQQYASNPAVIYLRDEIDKGPQYYLREGLRKAYRTCEGCDRKDIIRSTL